MIIEWEEKIRYFKTALEIGKAQHPIWDKRHMNRLVDLHNALIDKEITNSEAIDLAFLLLNDAYKDFKKEKTKLGV
jgi:hypothetical protein